MFMTVDLTIIITIDIIIVMITGITIIITIEMMTCMARRMMTNILPGITITIQWSIQVFLRRDASSQSGGANLLFCPLESTNVILT